METLPPITRPPTIPEPEGADPAIPPLPPPDALTDVMNRISDAGVPGAEKTRLIESATPGDAESMDRFGQALRDGGYAPVRWEARDLRWAQGTQGQGTQGKVLALVTLKTANPQARDFSFPMEFNFVDDSWQLTRRTADALLHLGEDAPVPPPTATPKPTP
jgi:hypothetical protein